MKKSYFEMNDKEKQYHLLCEILDYAICVTSEGICGTGEYSISTSEVIELQEEISGHLHEALSGVNRLRRSVEEKREYKTGDTGLQCADGNAVN